LHVAPQDPLLQAAIHKFYFGELDPKTLKIIEGSY